MSFAALRFVCHVISGVVFFASYAPEGQSVWVYSSAYNSVILIDLAICLVVAAIPQLRKLFDNLKYNKGI